MRIDEDQTEGEELPSGQLVTFNGMKALEGIRKTEGWRRVTAGEYEVFRDGTKKILISMKSILRRRKRQLRKADFSASRSQKGTRGFAPKDAVTA